MLRDENAIVPESGLAAAGYLQFGSEQELPWPLALKVLPVGPGPGVLPSSAAVEANREIR
jgi:hypothetical protein